MALVTVDNLSIGYRGPPLLDAVNCQIESGQRIGLLGRNGAGKTTFMRMLHGDVQPDSGTIKIAARTKISLLPQDVPRDKRGKVCDVVADGLNVGDMSHHHDFEAEWTSNRDVEQILSRMELDAKAPFEDLSSGMKRRVLLAQSLVSSPDLLLLDEPTNHLDLNAITWLEDFLKRWKGTIIFVTHDRMFLQRIANRILEIDRGRIFDWSCGYDVFLKRKQSALDAEEKQNALFDKKLSQEEAWIRQGIKARRTRNEGRVRALKDLRVVRSQRRVAEGKVKLKLDEGARSGNLIAEVDRISFSYADDQNGAGEIFRDFSTIIMRGDKVGFLGPNGVGKTTLLRVLLGQLSPTQGTVRLGTNLQIAYFDQLREQLSEDQTVQENVAGDNDKIEIGGQSKHVIGYLQDFLFNPERARTPVRFLSGGERNRVLLARLFSKSANVIVLDEPTNDLDTETLELLEDRLVEFTGTVLLVSHDRAFLNNVVTSSIVFEPEGVKEYVGGYDDWLRQRAEPPANNRPLTRPNTPTRPKTNVARKTETTVPQKKGERRLSYREQRELAELPATIEHLETEMGTLHALMAQSDFYQNPGERIATEQDKLKELEVRLATAYQRWEELEVDH